MIFVYDKLLINTPISCFLSQYKNRHICIVLESVRLNDNTGNVLGNLKKYINVHSAIFAKGEYP